MGGEESGGAAVGGVAERRVAVESPAAVARPATARHPEVVGEATAEERLLGAEAEVEGRRGAREVGAGEGARGEAGGGAEGGAGRRGEGQRRAQKRARAEEAQGLVRAVRVVGLGDVKVRVREGEVLRLRHVLGGACDESVRTQRMRFSRRHTFDSLGSQGNNNAIGGGG